MKTSQDLQNFSKKFSRYFVSKVIIDFEIVYL